MRKTLALALLAALLIPALGHAQEKTITFWHIQSTGDGPMLLQQAADRYMADNPDVRVEIVPMQNDPYKTRIRTAMGAGDPPCIFPTWGGGPLLEYVRGGQVVDLTDRMNEGGYVDRFVPAALTNTSFDGRIYGVPVENTAVAVVWYNRDLFEEHGLTPPETYDELLEIVETLRANDVAPFALANKTKWTGSMYYMYLVARLGGPGTFQAAANRTGGSFEDPAFVEAGRMLQDLVEMGAFNEGFNGLDYDTGQSRMLLYGGRAAMELMGSWHASTVRGENPDFLDSLGFFNFPAIEEGEGDPSNLVGTIGDNYYHVSATCEHPDEAFELLQYAIDDESVEVRIADGRIPPVVGVGEQLEDPLLQDLFGLVENAESVQLWYDQYLPPELGEAHKDIVQALLGLEITPEEAASRHEQAVAGYYGE